MALRLSTLSILELLFRNHQSLRTATSEIRNSRAVKKWQDNTGDDLA